MLPDAARPMAMAEVAWKRDHPNRTLPWTEGDPASFKRYADATAAREDQRAEALTKRPGAEQKLGEHRAAVGRNQQRNPALDGLMKKITPTTGSWSLVASDDAERALAQQIDKLGSEKYVEGLSDPNMGNRKTQQEMVYVGKALSGVLNTRKLQQVGFPRRPRAAEGAKSGRRTPNAYGKSGDFTGMDPESSTVTSTTPIAKARWRRGSRTRLRGRSSTMTRSHIGRRGLKAGTPKSRMIHILRSHNYNTKGLN